MKLAPAQVQEKMSEIPEWTFDQEEEMLTSAIEFKDFEQAIEFVNYLADLAETENHHPDIYVHDAKFVQVILYSHDFAGVTEKDIEMAKKIDGLISEKPEAGSDVNPEANTAQA